MSKQKAHPPSPAPPGHDSRSGEQLAAVNGGASPRRPAGVRPEHLGTTRRARDEQMSMRMNDRSHRAFLDN